MVINTQNAQCKMTDLWQLASASSMIDVIMEIAEDCREFEFSLLGRYYGLLIMI